MEVLEIAFVLAVYSIISCFQLAAGILANQTGRSFWLWFGIATILPIISLFILIYLWDVKTVEPQNVVIGDGFSLGSMSENN